MLFNKRHTDFDFTRIWYLYDYLTRCCWFWLNDFYCRTIRTVFLEQHTDTLCLTTGSFEIDKPFGGRGMQTGQVLELVDNSIVVNNVVFVHIEAAGRFKPIIKIIQEFLTKTRSGLLVVHSLIEHFRENETFQTTLY